MEVAFRKGRELIRKMASEIDFSSRIQGQSNWDATKLVNSIVSIRHSQLPQAKYSRPKEADIVMLMDISGSCAQQAEMFMAISAGAIGKGVRIHTGFNGRAKVEPLAAPTHKLSTYTKGVEWIKREQNRQKGQPDSLTFVQFLKITKPKICIIFGDWDGRYEYLNSKKFLRTDFYWFCNFESMDSNVPDPEVWDRKHYFPGIYRPNDMVRCLKKLRI
jgi:hypothetical protein